MSTAAMSQISGFRDGGVQGIMAMRQQIIERSQILQELRSAGSSQRAAPVQQDGTSGFAATLQTALHEVNATQHKASELSAAYERGEVTDIASVMLARQESNLAFETTLQVRNKLLSAYQEIMRMGV